MGAALFLITVMVIAAIVIGWAFLGLLAILIGSWLLICGAYVNWKFFFEGEEDRYPTKIVKNFDEYMIKGPDEMFEYHFWNVQEQYFCSRFKCTKFKTFEEAEAKMMEEFKLTKGYYRKEPPAVCKMKKAFYDWLTKDCE